MDQQLQTLGLVEVNSKYISRGKGIRDTDNISLKKAVQEHEKWELPH